MQVPAIKTNVIPIQASSGLRETATAFADVLSRAIGAVNELQARADTAAVMLAEGSEADVHSVMVAVEEANLALQLTIQVRNKLLDAYQELVRMQV